MAVTDLSSVPATPHDIIQLYGLWVQSGAIVVAAVGVIATILWSKRIACRRATLDIVLSEETDPSTIEQRTEFVKLRDAGHLSQWASPDKTHSDNSAILRSVLNRYELVAIGIDKGIIDEKSYKKWCRSTLVKDWIECKAFVMQIRHNASVPTFYCEFETLAKRWSNKEERQHV